MKKKIVWAFVIIFIFSLGYIGGHYSSPNSFVMQSNAELEKENQWYATSLQKSQDETRNLCDYINKIPGKECSLNPSDFYPTSSLKYLP